MASEKFDAGSWVERLAQALKELALVQQGRRDGRHMRNLQIPPGVELYDSTKTILEFYDAASRMDGWRVSPVQAAGGWRSGHSVRASRLGGIAEFVRLRPDLYRVSQQRKHQWPAAGHRRAAGVCRKTGKDGFGAACSELNLLLDPGDEKDRDPRRKELLDRLPRRTVPRSDSRRGDAGRGRPGDRAPRMAG